MKKSDRHIEKQRVIATFDTHARTYQDLFMSLGPYEGSLRILSNLISVKSCKLLEIGCGPGNITKYLWEQNNDFSIVAIDISEEMVKYAKSNVPTADVFRLDCRDVKRINLIFDAVVCGFCLPYLDKTESNKLIQDIASMLHPGGWLYMSTIMGSYSNSRPYSDSSGTCDPVMTYFHEKDELVDTLKEYGFHLILTEILPQKHHYEESKGDLIIIAKKRGT